MSRGKKVGGNDPAKDSVKISQSGDTGASHSNNTFTVRTSNDERVSHDSTAQYSIVHQDAQKQHDPLEEALSRLDAAYTDAVNMAIAHWVDRGLITEEEARRIYEGRQVWQEVRL